MTPPARVWAQWSGPDDRESPAVAFVHGAPDTGRSFLPVVERLPGVRALVYDRRGWGRSVDVTPPATSIGDHVDDLLALLDERAGRPTTVVAHSFGCCIALLASIRRPDVVCSLGLWEPPVPWEDWWSARARERVASIAAAPSADAVGERLVRTVLGDATWDGLSDAARARRRAEGRAFITEAREQLVRPFHLEEITVPCVIAVGEGTWDHMADAARRISAIVGAELIVVPGAEHFGHVTHPDAFAELARRAMAAARRTGVSTSQGGQIQDPVRLRRSLTPGDRPLDEDG